MSNFLKLLNFEWNRFIKLYSILFALILVVQVIGLLLLINDYNSTIQLEFTQNNMSLETFLESYGSFGLDYFGYSLWFIASIAISIAALLLYVPFIWYRDWFARHTFIYRLFMLPTSRMNLFLAKLTTIMIGVLSVVAYQILLLVLYKEIIKWMIPSMFRNDIGVLEFVMESAYLPVIIPTGFMEFFVAYSLGLSAVVVIFTVILMERSFSWIGLLIGMVYIPTTIIIFLTPVILTDVFPIMLSLYPSELFFVKLALWIIITASSLWLSSYLLKRKVTV